MTQSSHARILSLPNYFAAAVATLCMALGVSIAHSGGPTSVALVDLLANIEKYSGKEVTVMGYFAAHANLTLFESKAHSESRAYLSSLVVGDYDQMELHSSECIDKIVELTGEIASGAANNFILIGVTQITLVSTNEVCWELPVE